MTDLSFEVFAPKSIPASFQLYHAMDRLARFKPKFTSVTCGTGGGSQSLTQGTLTALAREQVGSIAAHMTCGNQEMPHLIDTAKTYRSRGVSSIVALRGDLEKAPKAPDVTECVAGLAENTDLDILVAAYPEKHPKAESDTADLDALLKKQEAGATAAISQFFFDADVFLKFRDRAIAHGITIPIYPGVLPVTNWAATHRMAVRCGTYIEPDLAEGFARAAREDRAALMAVAHASEICDRLIRQGVQHLHFYTMNRADAVADICCALGFDQSQPLRRVA